MASTIYIERRNIVVLGKTGAGKSTVANKILDRDTFEVADRPSSVTSDVRHAEIAIRIGNTQYEIKVIDTIGLFDTKVSNATVWTSVKKYFRETVPEGVDLVLFIYRNGRFTEEERATFAYITTNFKKEISAISALVITGCDGMTPDKRQKLVTEFETNSRTASIASFMGKGIFTVGFPDITQMNPVLQSAYKQLMEDDAQALRNLAFKSDKKYLTKEMFEEAIWERLKSGCTIL